jgi:hypothetical protein
MAAQTQENIVVKNDPSSRSPIACQARGVAMFTLPCSPSATWRWACFWKDPDDQLAFKGAISDIAKSAYSIPKRPRERKAPI